MGTKRHDLASHKVILLGVAGNGQGRSGKQRRQVECGQGFKNNHLVSCICVDALVQREVGRVVVEGLVQGRLGGWICAGKTSNKLLKVALALGGGDGGSGSVVVVEGLACVSVFTCPPM